MLDIKMTQPTDRTQPTAPADKLEDAIRLAKAGQKIAARDVLRRIVALQPVNQAAWLWLSALAADKTEAEAALAQARKINPAHPSLARAEQWLAHRFSPQPPTRATEVAAPPRPPSMPKTVRLFGFFNRFAFGLAVLAVLIGVMVLLVGVVWQVSAVAHGERVAPKQTLAVGSPQPDASILAEAWAEHNWPRVIAVLEARHQAEPDSWPVTQQLSLAYLQQGLTLRHKGYVGEALPLFEQAVDLTPDQPQAQQEFQLASDYLTGGEHYQAGRWQEAIASLARVWAEDTDYIHVKDLLYSAYFNHGLALAAADELLPAKDAFEAAIALRPDLAEPRLQVAEIEFVLAPQTPLSTPLAAASARDKLIVVGIAEQRMYVYEAEQQVFDFVVSTGEPGRDTAIGEFEILNKIDVAYASTWNLDMPYWLGIYWAGPLQNGIHSLPIVKHTGYKLWDGYLGQRVSYGCIILSDEDAATLYDWAEIGARVKIVYSLANGSLTEPAR